MTINEKKEVLNKLTDTEFGDMFGRLLGNQGFSNKRMGFCVKTVLLRVSKNVLFSPQTIK